jgi:hypothetical protein
MSAFSFIRLSTLVQKVSHIKSSPILNIDTKKDVLDKYQRFQLSF